jgi:hypothetical protein
VTVFSTNVDFKHRKLLKIFLFILEYSVELWSKKRSAWFFGPFWVLGPKCFKFFKNISWTKIFLKKLIVRNNEKTIFKHLEELS